MSPVRSPEEALETFYMPPGYRLELVAAEPLVQDPVAIDFDADGRMWVVEMRAYMPNVEGEGEEAPIGRIVVLQDTDDDGRMDDRTVYLDSLVLPRAVEVLEHGVLVATPPYLWFTQDTDGDLVADVRRVVRDDYGDPESNPEHNANGLVWGMDNWIHNANYGGEFRFLGDTFAYRSVPQRGQWGVSMDDYGRYYRNSNEDPLRVDLVPVHYLGRNPALRRPRGVYERMYETKEVWPVRPTPGVNRGYRTHVLREDGTLAAFTAAGSPVVYRGDRLPEELQNNVFVTEPAGNLVRRYVVTEQANGTLSARNAYERGEFIASTDERFRPVNLYSAPDGTLYVVDMYRGIIQHRRYVTGYLEDQIRKRELEQPVGLGRIYRVVHTSTRRDEQPRLSGYSPVELVALLEHPNGWWRDTAQRLLVERGDRSVVPALRKLAASAGDERTRLHALWTLDGLGAAEPDVLEPALSDPSPHVRAAALRIAEAWLAQPDHPLQAAVIGMVDDPAPLVRWQLVATLGELPPAEREGHLATMLTRYGDDPVAVDVAISGIPGQEVAMLQRLLTDSTSAPEHAVGKLAAAVMQGRDKAGIQSLIAWVGEESRPRWQRLALLNGIAEALPEPAWGTEQVPSMEIDYKPAGLLAAAASGDSAVHVEAARIVDRLIWPGKPRPAGSTGPRPLTPEEQQRFDAGKQIYLSTCAGCHQQDGMGMPGVAKPLVGSPWVTGRADHLLRILLHGKEGEMLMPGVGATLSNEEIAAVSTYIRRMGTNQASPVDPEQVHEVRGVTTGRDQPWTEEELARAGR